MTKEELIHQVLNTTNIKLYQFWAVKLLNEYPEIQQKVADNWESISVKIGKVQINPLGHITSTDLLEFYFVFIHSLEHKRYLNWTLRQDGYE